MKIIINTNINYKIPLSHLLKSIISSDFNNYDDIVIVVSQCDENISPRREPLRNLVNFDTDISVVVVRLKINNYDYAGLAALYEYKDNDLINAEHYLYLLDSSEVTEDFNSKISQYENIGLNEIVVHGPEPCSNIVIFGRDVINQYGDSFMRNFTKEEATMIEYYQEPVVIGGRTYKNFWLYENVIPLPTRESIGSRDVYNNGHARWIFHYPTFGVYKFVFLYKTGDIENNVTDIDLTFF